jgi:hypothetical protein
MHREFRPRGRWKRDHPLDHPARHLPESSGTRAELAGAVAILTSMRARLAVVAVLSAALWLAAAPPLAARDGGLGAWKLWRSMRGVVDIAGPRSDGRFVVAARGRLFLLRPRDGRLSPYPAKGVEYAANPKLEPYLTVAGPGQRVPSARCSFPRDTVYAIEPAGRTRVFAVTPAGRVRSLARISGVKTLNGIVFDTTGRFGGQLLVVGLTADGHGVLASVDCLGRTRVRTRSAPHLEGGLAIAPAAFGAFAGDLIAPDEVDGRLLALAPDGSVRDLVDPGQPAGGDIGVESLGIVPDARASAYLADRRTPGNANPGHDSILRIGAGALGQAGVLAGDLLVTLEGGGTTIDVHCAAACTAREVATAPSGAHAEGSIAFAP